MEDKIITTWILALFRANNYQPIRGKKKFVYQMFIAAKEIAEDKNVYEVFEFFPE